jgi:hypothetical protein
VTNRTPIHRGLGIFLILAGASVTVGAQHTTSAPATDSATQASPLQPAPHVPAVDAATEASPITQHGGHGISIAPHTAVPIQLDETIDSGKLKNGQTVAAKLTAAVRAGSTTLPAGTPVSITVVATVPAGKLTSMGEFSLQVLSVGRVGVYTDTQTFRGRPGHRDVADATPAVGTDAGLPTGAPLTFHVLPPPSAATAAPRNTAHSPGSVNGTASGGPPPPGSVPARPVGAMPPDSSTATHQQATPQTTDTTSVPIHGATPSQPTKPQ